LIQWEWNVTVPLSKLVFGLAIDTGSDTNFFISPEQVQTAWGALEQKELLSRRSMFWTIDEEGTNGVNLAQGLQLGFFVSKCSHRLRAYLSEFQLRTPAAGIRNGRRQLVGAYVVSIQGESQPGSHRCCRC
jgi:hypothetical protein